DHEQREDEDSPERARRRAAGLHAVLDAALDVGLETRRDALHVHEEAAHEGRRDEREGPLPERLVRGSGEEESGAGTGHDGDGDRGIHGAGEGAAAGAAEIRQREGDDQERLDALTQRDGESLPHLSLSWWSVAGPLDTAEGVKNTPVETESQSQW